MKAIYYEQTGEAKKVLKSGTFDDPQVKKDEVVLEILYSNNVFLIYMLVEMKD